MNPVAWMYYDERKNLKLCQTMPPDDNSFPVYTAPRELSDEEIMDACIVGGIYDCINDPYMQKDGKYSLDADLIKFARAILKKASEK